MRTVLTVIAFACVTGGLAAQPTPPAPPLPPPAPLPPGQVVANPLPPASGELPLPGGKEVSQPLQPVGPAAVDAPAPAPASPAPSVVLPPVKSIPPERPHGPLGPAWNDIQFLNWWPERPPVPPLLFGTNSGQPPAPGQYDTRLLAGGRAFTSQPSAGGRFTLGFAVDREETLGLEATYFFLGSRKSGEYVQNSGAQSFGVPYTNAVTGASEILTLAQPGVANSIFSATSSVRVQGWEVNGIANIMDEKYLKLNAIVGWRYLQVNEWLQLDQTQLSGAGTARTMDQFNTQNRFNGGQLGLHADVRRGLVFCEMTAKVAFGQNYEVVNNDGYTVLQTSATRVIGNSGLYVQPSSAGRTANGVFAVVPEGTIKFGFRVGESGRLYVGYSIIYLSDAVRPGDQIDRTLNPAQVPLVSGTAPLAGADRPSRLFNRSDFWAQGLIVGLETRF